MTTAAISIFPSGYSTTYVKTTNSFGANWDGWRATDPSKSVTGARLDNGWFSSVAANKIQIEFGSPYRATRIYIENDHDSGGSTTSGIQAFTVYGSNSATDLTTVTYLYGGTWKNLVTSPTSLAQHVASDVADPQYVEITNPDRYKYYMLKVGTTWGSTSVGLRRITFMAEPPEKVTLPLLPLRGRGRMR